MRSKNSEPLITMDLLQPVGDQWVQAQAIQGDVQATMTLHPAPDRRWPDCYVLDAAYDRANVTAAGKMGKRQEERARALLLVLQRRVLDLMRAAGWSTPGQSLEGKTLWRFIGPAILAQEHGLAALAARVRQRHPPQIPFSVAPLSDFPRFGILREPCWHPVSEDLEVWVNFTDHQVIVRTLRPEPVDCTPPCATQGEIGVSQRTRRKVLARFICARCNLTVEEEHGPRAKPRYCRACKDAISSERSQARGRSSRVRNRAGGNITKGAHTGERLALQCSPTSPREDREEAQ